MFFFIANTLNSLKCFDATLFCISLFSLSDICYKMEDLAIGNSLVCLVFDILKAAVRKVQVPFLESPETLQAHFRWHDSLYIFKTKASQGTKLCNYFYFYSLYNL